MKWKRSRFGELIYNRLSILAFVLLVFSFLIPRASVTNNQSIKITADKGEKSFRWALLTIPEPFSRSPLQFAALQSWLHLSKEPAVFFIDCGGFDAVEAAAMEEKYGTRTIKANILAPDPHIRANVPDVLRSISFNFSNFDAIVLVHPKTILANSFVSVLEYASSSFQEYLMVQYPSVNADSVSVPTEPFAWWIEELHRKVRKTGLISNCEGPAVLAWSPTAFSSELTLSSVVRDDITLIDASSTSSAMFTSRGENHILDHPRLNAQTTPSNRHWILSFCHKPSTKSDVPCIQRSKESEERNVLFFQGTCDHVQKNTFGQGSKRQDTFEILIQKRALNNTIIMFPFNYGYREMLLNMLCQMRKLEIMHYIIIALEDHALEFCRQLDLPCSAAEYDMSVLLPSTNQTNGSIPKKESVVNMVNPDITEAPPEAKDYGSDGFNALTKLKPFQAWKALKLGYNVMLSDVDIFWKTNFLPLLEEEQQDNDILIQSNALQSEERDNGKMRTNSGFFYAKANTNSLNAMALMILHAHSSNLTEQHSFYAIMCGDWNQYAVGKSYCVNKDIPLKVKLLSRKTFPNGGMTDYLRGVTATSEDQVQAVHFNWRIGKGNKTQSLVNAKMWVMDREGRCPY